uniref:Periviscerokinin-1 n=1 Tax=Bantua robusta TaxID=344686 RepID=PVK1_BANRO|nr:RecName: Full=Periviscerokinin-1; Short=BanRo-PVK-1 [Bantua robusta]
GSTGLISFGRT